MSDVAFGATFTEASALIKNGKPAGLAIHIACNGDEAKKSAVAKELGKRSAAVRRAKRWGEELHAPVVGHTPPSVHEYQETLRSQGLD